jgi:hypothetical protein
MTDKRYTFAFHFVFDRKVEPEFLFDLYEVNEPKLKKLGYEVSRTKTPKEDKMVAIISDNKLIDVVGATAASQQNLLHFTFDRVCVTLNNTLLLSPDEKHERIGDFKYRDGEWKEVFNDVAYEFSASLAKRFATVTARFIPGHDRKKWRDSLVYVIQGLHHSAFLAKRLKELVYAMQGDDEAFKIAAQGKMAAAVAYRSV